MEWLYRDHRGIAEYHSAHPGGGNEAANCLGGACCDPTNTPGYPVAVAGGDNLLRQHHP